MPLTNRRLGRPVDKSSAGVFFTLFPEVDLFEPTDSAIVVLSGFGERFDHFASATPAFDYFRQVESSALSGSAQRARILAGQILRRATSNETPLPTVSADDDGGVVLYWRAGRQVVHVDVTPEAEFYVRIAQGDGSEAAKWSSGPFPLERVRSALASFPRGLAA